MSLSRDRFREREWKCSEKHHLIKRVSKIATVNYLTEHLLFVKFVEELLHVGTKLSPLDKTVQFRTTPLHTVLYASLEIFDA